MAIMGAAQGAMQLIQGVKQGNQADALKAGNKRPVMGIPKGIKQAENIYQNNAYGTRLPGQGYLENQLQQSTANGMRAISETAQDPASKLAAISSLYGNQMAAQDKIGFEAANNYYGNQQNLAQFLGGTKANAEREVFDYNAIKPYEETAAAASALEGASLQNKYKGTSGLLGSIGGVAGLGINNAVDKNVYGAMYRKQNPNATQQDINQAFMSSKRYGTNTLSSQRASGGGDRSIYDKYFGKKDDGFSFEDMYNTNYQSATPYIR